MSTKIISSLLLVLFLSCGCAPTIPDVGSTKMSKKFFSMSMNDRIKIFDTYSLEDQYDIYLYGIQAVRPPTQYLATPFAKQGQVIVPFLKRKLEIATSEVTIEYIILVFERLARFKLYDFSKDQELMDLLDRRADEIQGNSKSITLKFISEIRRLSDPEN